MRTHLSRLRAQAIAHSLFPETTLGAAIEQLGFVQADPIRAPARAQELILRQRIHDYRVGDLDRAYPDLELEEGLLYAYGFMPRRTWSCLHPRAMKPMSKLEKGVLAAVGDLEPIRPSDLDEHFGRKRVRNAWGGYSRATKRALEALHRRGLLRIAGRQKGARTYETAPSVPEAPAEERLERLAMVVARVFAPAPKRSLRSVLARIGRGLLDRGAGRRALEELLRKGELQEKTVDGVAYVSPVDMVEPEEAPARVRILAPFDPLVHDRDRFEHLWGWVYRFEAYTPVAERVRGYYAMPLLWRDRLIGWANVTHEEERMNADLGFVARRPREAAFRRELAAELGRLETFLGGRGTEGGGRGTEGEAH